ncbi:hypothetical protein NFI96_016520 [Prochilodus magdalenae]|nr:hypothetical protein NFI96_016520 [Prochilodus magdalenae]
MDPHQFAYHSNRSIDDAIALTVHTVLTHLDRKNTYVRMLFIAYSAETHPQAHRFGFELSSVQLDSGLPDRSCPQPPLYSLFTHDCVARHTFSIIFKFVDDTTMLGLITDGDCLQRRGQRPVRVQLPHQSQSHHPQRR